MPNDASSHTASSGILKHSFQIFSAHSRPLGVPIKVRLQIIIDKDHVHIVRIQECFQEIPTLSYIHVSARGGFEICELLSVFEIITDVHIEAVLMRHMRWERPSPLPGQIANDDIVYSGPSTFDFLNAFNQEGDRLVRAVRILRFLRTISPAMHPPVRKLFAIFQSPPVGFSMTHRRGFGSRNNDG